MTDSSESAPTSPPTDTVASGEPPETSRSSLSAYIKIFQDNPLYLLAVILGVFLFAALLKAFGLLGYAVCFLAGIVATLVGQLSLVGYILSKSQKKANTRIDA